MEPLPVELMNTVWADRSGVHDSLATQEQALAWLGRTEPRLEGDLRDTVTRLRELRDALRVLAAEVTGRREPGDRDAAIKVVNRSCALAPQWSSLRWPAGREVHSDGRPGDVFVSSLAERAVELFSGDERALLRACLAPGCVQYFVKQHPRREWCSAGCGNRARVARHYQRHRP